MERINQFALYQIGQTFQKLRGYSQDVAPAEVFADLIGARAAIKNLVKGDPIPVGVSHSTAEVLEQSLNSIFNQHYYVKDDDGKRQFVWPEPTAEKIPSWRWGSMLSELEKFETVFAEEMRDCATYFVPRRGIFDTQALVDAADQTFPTSLAPFIPEKTREDWKAAGRCLAFNLRSASGFHVARAVEGTLEAYYQRFCDAEAGTTLKSWNDYIVALKGARDSGVTPAPSEKIIAEIQQMKDDYRNPIAHPRIVLNEADARMLFANGESVIIGMIQELAQAAVAGVQPMLGLINTAPVGALGVAE